jgi:hypothetical protein
MTCMQIANGDGVSRSLDVPSSILAAIGGMIKRVLAILSSVVQNKHPNISARFEVTTATGHS